MPYYPKTADVGQHYYAETFFEHLVFEYSGIPIDEQQQLPYLVWLQLRFDAYVNRLNQTEEGRKYLEDAWLFSQTKPDRSGLMDLRRMMKGG